MPITDPIADALTRIRNAVKAKYDSVDVPASKMIEGIVEILKKEGFIKDYRRTQEAARGTLRIYLRYSAKREPILMGLRRASRPSRRRYVRAGKIRRVLNGLGIGIISTSKGLLTDQEARKANLGGEVICEAW